MKSYAVTTFGEELETLEQPTPEPIGTEVLLKVRRCGVCHSDVHIWDGYYDLGGGKKLDLAARGIQPPVVMGHEVFGEVVATGPNARDLPVGTPRLIYPWIGCGECRVCKRGEEQNCMKPRSLGVYRPGGYADHIRVPHPRYLFDIGNIDPGVAATYACSGLTAFSAIRKTQPLLSDDWLVMIGAGGLGLNCISLLQALGIEKYVVVDIDAQKLQAAQGAGAPHVVNARDPDALKQLQAKTDGGATAVIDFVGSTQTAELAMPSLIKGGKYVVVGLFGGEMSISLPLIPVRALGILGSYTGSMRELSELLELAKRGDVAPIPVTPRALNAESASEALRQVKDGKVLGRIVLEA